MNALSRKTNNPDVLIAGGGPLGWACGRLLARNKIRTVIVDPNIAGNVSAWMEKGLGVFWPSLNDPPTRAVVAHGLPMARWLQDYCKHGQNLIPEFFPLNELKTLKCVRAGILGHEIDELNKAAEQNLGLSRPQTFAETKIFEEHAPAYWLSERTCAEIPKNERQFLSLKCDRVEAFAESNEFCTSKLSSGEQINSEMILLANGFEISKLEPWLKDMLIPMTDIESHWTTGLICPPQAEPVAVRACNGHVASVFYPHQDSDGLRTWAVRMTGPRFLLPSAGAGINLSGEKVDDDLKNRLQQWLVTFYLPALMSYLRSPEPADFRVELRTARYATDCLPCDELPVLGDVGRLGRVLASTGWLACGWSASLQSAKIVSELIELGQSSKLAPLLKPIRWRSGLTEDGVTGMT